MKLDKRPKDNTAFLIHPSNMTVAARLSVNIMTAGISRISAGAPNKLSSLSTSNRELMKETTRKGIRHVRPPGPHRPRGERWRQAKQLLAEKQVGKTLKTH